MTRAPQARVLTQPPPRKSFAIADSKQRASRGKKERELERESFDQRHLAQNRPAYFGDSLIHLAVNDLGCGGAASGVVFTSAYHTDVRILERVSLITLGSANTPNRGPQLSVTEYSTSSLEIVFHFSRKGGHRFIRHCGTTWV